MTKLADRTAAPDRDGVTRLDVALLGGHVAGGEDVRQEEHLVVGDPVGYLDGTDIGEGHTDIFGLAAGVSAEQVGVAEQARRGMAPHLFGEDRVGVGILAE